MERARERRRGGRHTIFFLDEIHRFNKAQQDALLPAVEEGLVVLVGATTENPYFEVNSALISRTQVYELQELTAEDIAGLLRRALDEVGRFGQRRGDRVHVRALGGDARSSLNALELALDTAARTGEAGDAGRRRGRDAAQGRCATTRPATSTTTTSRPSSSPCAGRTRTRRSTTWRRCSRAARTRASSRAGSSILASEDVGNADPQALPVAVAAAHAVEHVGLPECTFALSQATIYLSLAPKSNAAGKALGAARAQIREHGAALPPAALRSAAYPAARKLGRGIGYDYPHDHPGASTTRSTCPRAASTCASTSPATPSPSCASA